jgi:hypothetical protein
MEQHGSIDTRHRPPAPGVELSLGLWMRSAIAGVAFVAVGIAYLIDSPPGGSFAAALLWIVLGGAFAWIGWQRTTALLDRIDADVPIPSPRDDASSQRPALRVPASC